MRVSVVIPTFNGSTLVMEAVESVLKQTRPADEILVVDDGSIDDTPQRLARLEVPVRVIRKENGGVSTARNLGVREAKGDIIAFLDADDVWHPRKLEIQLAAMAARPEFGLLGSLYYLWPTMAHSQIEQGICPIDTIHLDDLLICNHIVTSTVVARADVLRAVGPFDSRLQGPEDHDLWIRVARKTRVGNLRAALTGYREGTPSSLSKNAERMEAGMRVILEKIQSEGHFRGRPLLKRKAWSHFRYSCGLIYRAAGDFAVAADRFLRSLANWPLPLAGPPHRSIRRSAALFHTFRMILRSRKVSGDDTTTMSE